MVNYLLPGKFGEVVKSYVADEDRNISKGVVFGTVVVERILDLAFILLLGVFLPPELKARVPVVKKISIDALILLFVVLGGILIMHQFREKLTKKDYRGWIGKVMLVLPWTGCDWFTICFTKGFRSDRICLVFHLPSVICAYARDGYKT